MTDAATRATMASSSLNETRRRISLRAQNPEVYYSDDAIVAVDDATIAELKRLAAQNPRLRSRLCTHPDPSDGLHEMLIVHHREAYVRPHKHLGKPESFHVIEGTAQMMRIYVNEEDIRFLQNQQTALKDGDEISIIPAIAGG